MTHQRASPDEGHGKRELDGHALVVEASAAARATTVAAVAAAAQRGEPSESTY